MPKTTSTAKTISEWILACFVGRIRGAAIFGDLLELSANRCRVWFWNSYARTLVSVGWRSFLAFVAGFAGFCAMFSFLLATMRAPKAPGIAFDFLPASVGIISTGFLMTFGLTLGFTLPYAILQFGRRDRTALLCCASLVLAAPFLLLRGSRSPIFAMLMIALILAAFFSARWRKPMIVFAATSVTVLVTLEGGTLFAATIYHPHMHDPLGWLIVRLTTAIALATSAIVCSRLHRWLLEERSIIA